MLNPDTFSRLQEALVAEHDRWMNTYEEIVKVMQVVGVHMTPLSLWRRRLRSQQDRTHQTDTRPGCLGHVLRKDQVTIPPISTE